MRMRANARIIVNGRQLLVDRIQNAGWSLTHWKNTGVAQLRSARSVNDDVPGIYGLYRMLFPER